MVAKNNKVKAFVVMMCLSAFGCSNFTPGDPEKEMEPDPIQKGPGIFTGRSGDWVIIRR